MDEGRDIRLRNLHHDADAYTGEDARLTPRHGVPVVDAASGGAEGADEASGTKES